MKKEKNKDKKSKKRRTAALPYVRLGEDSPPQDEKLLKTAPQAKAELPETKAPAVSAKKSAPKTKPLPEKDKVGDKLLAHALDAVGGKWKLRLLLALSNTESLRYGELRSAVAGVTDMMLSQSLRELCAAGLVERRAYQQIPPRVEYRLTPKAKGACAAAAQLADWAKTL